jgi:Domain of unknown function (DUF4349)
MGIVGRGKILCRLTLSASVLMLVGFSGCSQTQKNRAAQTEGNALDSAPSPSTEAKRAPVAPTLLKLIRVSSIQVEVTDFDAAATALGQLAQSIGGYVADTQVTRHPSGYRSGQIVLRIPVERFDAVGTSIRTLGKVLSERSMVEDVTKAYTDLETRLRVKRDELARIRELLKTKAGSLKDILEAEREISRITEEIELAEGERQFYDHQIRLSTFTVELQEPEPVNLAGPGNWHALGKVFRNASMMISESLAVLLSLILVLIPWAAVGYGIYRWARWFIRRRKPKPQAEKDESASK